MKRDDKRRLARAVTPFSDRVKDALFMWFVKWVLVPGAVILVLIVLSLTKAPPN